MGLKRRMRVALLVVAVAAAAYVTAEAVAILAVAKQSPAVARGSTALVLGDHLEDGRPGPHFQQRLERAAELYRRGQVSRIIVSGGGAPPEAAAGRQYLLAQGIPQEVIDTEERSCSTDQNIQYSSALLQEEGLRGPVVIITNGFHLRRALLLAEKEGVRVTGVPAETTSPPLIAVWPNVAREIVATALVSLWTSPASC